MKLLYIKILIAVWFVIALTSFFVPGHLLEFYWGDTRVMSFQTAIWICICIWAFWAGSFIERSLYVGTRRHESEHPFVISTENFARSLKATKFLLFLACLIIFMRFVWCIYLSGGLESTLKYMLSEPTHFKFSYWQETNIHGVGMIAELLVASTIFSFAAFALVEKFRTHMNYRIYGYDESKLAVLRSMTVRLVVSSFLLLSIYLLLSNERIAFVGGFLGGAVAYFLIMRRFPFRKILYVVGLLIVIWIVIEAGRRQYLSTQELSFIVEYGKNRLLLYFVSGLRNIDTVLNYISDHSYGWFTLNFLLSPFKLDEIITVENFYGFSPYKIRPGFGVIPVFGTAFADYGFAGVCYFLIMGFIYQKLHRSAILKSDFLGVQIYSYCLVALIISFVAFLPSASRFWVNILALVVINKASRFGNVFLPSK